MASTEYFSIGEWIDSTINYQNEDVFMLYVIILIASLLLCIVTYKNACSTQRDMDGKE